MHGSLRFILALLVALSHLGVTHTSFNQGVFAVVIFYMLAGMVSYKLITNHFQNKPILYYKNRIKRIFPLYLLSLIIAFIVYIFGATSHFLSTPPNLIDLFANLTIIPLSYYMFTAQDTFTLLPPAWSLGVELQFYLLAPFLLVSKRLFTYIFIFSFIIFILASIGVLNTDYYGYRLIVGVIFIFLLGTIIQKNNLNYLKIIYFITIILSIYIYSIEYKAPYNYETISALLLGIPLLMFLKTNTIMKIKSIPYIYKTDKYLGQLSYGIFLLHFPMLWLVKITLDIEPSVILILFLTLILTIMLEKFIKNYPPQIFK